MTISNIFKMEMYRNFRDRAYLIIIGVLTGLFAIATGIGISLIQVQGSLQNSGNPLNMLFFFEGLFVFALFLAFVVFAMIYPWHLLSTDYNNRVLSLVVASGVKREKYYFVKLLATLVSNFMAYFVIGFIPVLLFLGFFHKEFIRSVQSIIKGLTLSQSWLTLGNALLSSIAMIILLYFVVILTRGKFWGIFVFLGIRLGLGMISSMILFSLATVTAQSEAGLSSLLMGTNLLSFILVCLEIIIFGLIGFLTLERQNL